MFGEAVSDQKEFLEQAKSARRGREEQKYHQAASIAIQAGARGFLARIRLKKKIRKVRMRERFDCNSRCTLTEFESFTPMARSFFVSLFLSSGLPSFFLSTSLPSRVMKVEAVGCQQLAN